MSAATHTAAIMAARDGLAQAATPPTWYEVLIGVVIVTGLIYLLHKFIDIKDAKEIEARK